jgi:hypothetical protein
MCPERTPFCLSEQRRANSDWFVHSRATSRLSSSAPSVLRPNPQFPWAILGFLPIGLVRSKDEKFVLTRSVNRATLRPEVAI